MIRFCKVKNCRYPQSHVTFAHQCGSCKLNGHGIVECGNYNDINSLKYYYHEVLPYEDYCLFGGCPESNKHTTESHTCLKCYGRLHSLSTCPTNIKSLKECNISCPKCRKINKNVFKSYGSDNKCIVCFEDAQIFLPECGHECLCLTCSNKIDQNKNQTNYYDEKYLIDNHYDVPLIKSHFKEYPSYVVVYESMGHSTIVRRLNENSEIEALFIHSDDGYDPNKIRINQEFMDGYCKITSMVNVNSL